MCIILIDKKVQVDPTNLDQEVIAEYSYTQGAARAILIGFFIGYIFFFTFNFANGLIGAGVFVSIYALVLIYKHINNLR